MKNIIILDPDYAIVYEKILQEYFHVNKRDELFNKLDLNISQFGYGYVDAYREDPNNFIDPYSLDWSNFLPPNLSDLTINVNNNGTINNDNNNIDNESINDEDSKNDVEENETPTV